MTIKKMLLLCMWWWIVNRLIVLIISQHIQELNRAAVHLKLGCSKQSINMKSSSSSFKILSLVILLKMERTPETLSSWLLVNDYSWPQTDLLVSLYFVHKYRQEYFQRVVVRCKQDNLCSGQWCVQRLITLRPHLLPYTIRKNRLWIFIWISKSRNIFSKYSA